MPHNDLKYWKLLTQGNGEAFAKLYSQYFMILYSYGCKICVDTGAVKDAIHDLFVDLWRYRSNLSASTSVRFYLYRAFRRRMARRGINVFITSSNDMETLPFEAPSKEFEIIESEIRDNRLHQLKRLLNDLSPRQYEALVLFFYDEFSYEEIAGIMHINAQSARNLVQRGLIQLRHQMKYIIH